VIRKEDLEHEVEPGAAKLAHARCAIVWREESFQFQADSATGN
jgi:hypothetical protein